jgi:hypothetical protein
MEVPRLNMKMRSLHRCERQRGEATTCRTAQLLPNWLEFLAEEAAHKRVQVE